MIPFFVADRPISLRILRGVDLAKYDGPLGIMTHAHTSKNFHAALRSFPCGAIHHPGGCDANCERLRRRVIKICDSGVFTKGGCAFEYPELFETYSTMGVDYGIMIDFLGDKEATLRSARRAMAEYQRGKYRFKLIGVAQGRSVREYLSCYRALKRMGYAYVAVGGLLRKRANTSHYVHVRGKTVFATLEAIREKFPADWLFALGCYHPSRHLRFEQLNLFGSDYKGWIFNYSARNHLGPERARRSRFGQVRRFLTREVFDSPLYLNGATGEIQLARKRGRTLVIVSCGRRKVWDDNPRTGPTRACDAYTGLFFRKNRSYAETFGDAWAILSAKHGLLAPEKIIRENYNQSFRARGETITPRDLRAQVLESGYHKFARIVVLGGREYAAAIKEAYAGTGIPIDWPYEGMPIGLMTQAVGDRVAAGRPFRTR